jgi:2-oxoglutarate dehydrogenase E2 component (dihydrolipoamide succinyltransferase)
MSVEIRVPPLGESIVDATIASWRKQEGDAVQRGDVLAELETEKINVEVSAEQDGVLQKITKQVGDTVEVGEVIGMIGEGAEASARSNGQETSYEQPQADYPQMYSTPPQQPPARKAPREQKPAESSSQGARAADTLRPPSPLARRIAAEHNVDLSQIKGSSPYGRVTREDVISYLERNSQAAAAPQHPAASAVQPAPAPQPSPPPSAPPVPTPQPVAETGRREERIRMSRRRQTIAQRLVAAQQTAAMLTTFNEIDMSAVMDIRSRRKETFKERHNISLGFMSFFTKAVVGALKAFPLLNAEIQGNEIVVKHYYDIGIAVATEEGLVVPVLRDADRKSFAQIEREIADLARQARENKLTLAALQGGTFTITNGGVFGSLLSTPILNAPQVGILGMHKIEQRPIALNGQVVIRPMMYVALSYDHRIVDGSEAVRFLVKIKELVEDPETLLLEG